MIRITSNMTDMKVVNWLLSRYCELTCHYCTSHEFTLTTKNGRHKVDYTEEELQIHDSIANALPKLFTNGQIMLYGGEPTLHPKGIEYFNRFCFETRNNPNMSLALVTHGDIESDKICSINTHGKKEHTVSISYHYYQVDFEKWFEKVKLFNKRCNVFVSAIIPRRITVWEQFEKNMQKIMDSGIPCELKSEHDNKTNEPDLNGLNHFMDMFTEALKNRDESTIPKLYLQEGNRIEVVRNVKLMGTIPTIPNRTVCKTGKFCITENILRRACEEGNSLNITLSTTQEDIERFINNCTVTCTKYTCTDSTNVTANMSIFGASLDDKRYQDFLETRL